MSAEPRAALNQLVAAFERHLEASSTRHGDDDPTVIAAYEDLADAFEAYDGALYDAYGEMTPLDIYSGDDDGEPDDDGDDEDDGDDGDEDDADGDDEDDADGDDELDAHDDEDGDGPRLYSGLDDDIEYDDESDDSDDTARR